jgi:2-dehydro-3-deoxygalactonokinase
MGMNEQLGHGGEPGPLLAVDWGTTSRRAWLLGGDGTILAAVEDGCGMLSIPPGGWEAAFADLKRALGDIEPSLSLITGMAGADRGWRMASYLPCPTSIADLAGGLCWVEPNAVAIVPGLAMINPGRADVMRGEETQILGAIAGGLAPEDCFACHPGTHTKWISVRGGRVTEFRTVMTGELFALLKSHSILADRLRDDVSTGHDFDSGVERGLATGEAIADLFAIRADAMSGAARIRNGAAYGSGLLIGADVRIGLAMSAEAEVHVIGRGDLVALYARAIERSGRTAVLIDGGTAVVAGLRRLANLAE